VEAPTAIKDTTHIAEAIDILASLGMPRLQLNTRTALCLLALVQVTPVQNWSEAAETLIGITPMMKFALEGYDCVYAPNSRETFRRFSMHQLVQAGIALRNPDNPSRLTNSPKTVYRIHNDVLDLVRTYGTAAWEAKLIGYVRTHRSLVDRYAMPRQQLMIPVRIRAGLVLLSPGAHNALIKKIIEELGPRFFPGSDLVYVGDTENKLAFLDERLMRDLNLKMDSHGKMPDVILYDSTRGWLVLVESVTSHGPVDSKRHVELGELCQGSSAGLVYVTAFPDRRAMARYVSDIAWETEVWAADAPTHLIHFNGDRFLGPHADRLE